MAAGRAQSVSVRRPRGRTKKSLTSSSSSSDLGELGPLSVDIIAKVANSRLRVTRRPSRAQHEMSK